VARDEASCDLAVGDSLGRVSDAQPWHAELAEGVDATVESVERYRSVLR